MIKNYDISLLKDIADREQHHMKINLRRARITSGCRPGSSRTSQPADIINRIRRYTAWTHSQIYRELLKAEKKIVNTYAVRVNSKKIFPLLYCLQIIACRIYGLEIAGFRKLSATLYPIFNFFTNSPEGFQLLLHPKKPYRDHLSHVVFTWLLGNDILGLAPDGTRTRALSLIQKMSEDKLAVVAEDFHNTAQYDITALTAIWDFAALCHDVGYFAFTAFEGIKTAFWDPKWVENRDAQKYFYKIAETAEDRYHGPYGKEIKDSARLDKHDNVGALCLYKRYYSQKGKFLDEEDALFLFAFNAILKHDSEITKGDWGKDSFGAFLKTIDTLQAFGRFFFGYDTLCPSPSIPVPSMGWKEDDKSSTISVVFSCRPSVDKTKKWSLLKFLKELRQIKKALGICPLFEDCDIKVGWYNSDDKKGVRWVRNPKKT